jgi:hypothetical protein
MDLSLNLGVFPAAVATAQKNGTVASAGQAFATADSPSLGQGLAGAGQLRASGDQAWALDGLAGFTDAAGNPIDTAMLAGAFRALVDELMGERTEVADDAAPTAGRRVTSEADDLAATLAGSSDAGEPESTETPSTTPAQLWLVELEIISRATGFQTDLPHRVAPSTTDAVKATPEPATELGEKPPGVNSPVAFLPDTIVPTVAMNPASVVPSAGPTTANATDVDTHVSLEASQNVTGQSQDLGVVSRESISPMPAQVDGSRRVGSHGTSSTWAPPRGAEPGRAEENAAELVVDSTPRRRSALIRLPASAGREVPVLPTSGNIAAADTTRRAESHGDTPDASIDGREAGSGSGFTAQRAGVAKPEGAIHHVDPRTLNRNLSSAEYLVRADANREVEPGVRITPRLQTFMSTNIASEGADTVSAEPPAHAAPKPPTTPSSSIESRTTISAPQPTLNQASDGMSQPGRRWEPSLPIARPIVLDAQSLVAPTVTSAPVEPFVTRIPNAAATTTASTPAVVNRLALPEETANQIVQAIRLQVTQNGGEATIRLEPKHFGELSIVVRVEHGQVSARLQAESPVVREYLQSHQSLLRDSLADQQLTLGKFEVAEPPAEPRNSERRSPEERAHPGDRQPQRRRQPSPGTPFEPFEVVV